MSKINLKDKITIQYSIKMSETSITARRLKEARIEAGLSQRQLGTQAGIDPFSASQERL